MFPGSESTAVSRSSIGALQYFFVGGIVTTLHAALFAFDVTGGDGFLRADRASQRIHAIKGLMNSIGDVAALGPFLVKQGNIGDYGVHAVFYWLGGPLGVILFQVFLAIVSAMCVTYIAWRAFFSKSVAILSGTLYGILPQSLAFPHQLVTEAISTPLIVIGTAGFVRALGNPGKSAVWILSGLAMGMGGLIRPSLELLPLMAAGLLMWLAPNRSSSIKPGIFCASALAPFVLWGLFMFVHEGSFGPGQSKQDLGTNLSESVAKVLLQEGLAPSDGQPPAWLPERLTLLEYARYVVRYPRGFAILYSTSALVMVVDSGIGRLYVDLMGFNADKRQQLIDAGIGWRAQLNNHGPIAMLRQGWKIAPQTLTVGVLGGVVFLLLDLGVVISYVRILRNASRRATGMAQLQQTWIRWFLPTVPLYVLITSEVVAYGASRLRSPAEFAWAILACFGWMSLSGSIALDNNEGSLSDRTHQSAQ